MKNQGALHSGELAKLPRDPDDRNEDIWQLAMTIRSLREQLEEFEAECQRKVNEQLCTLEGLLKWCDSLLYQSCELYSKRAKEDTDIPQS